MSSEATPSTVQQPVMNRWLVVVGAILIQLVLGIIYAWSAFTNTLNKPVNIENPAAGGYGFSTVETQWIFSIGLAFFAIAMLFSGRWQAKSSPRLVATVGGILLGAGYVLGGLLGKTFVAQLVCIGMIGGLGIGIAYVVPIAVGIKWFPDKKGMITGLAVAGFGFGAVLWIKLAGTWFGGLINTTHVFGLPGVQSVYVIYGIACAILVLVGSTVMVPPPAGWKPAGWEPPPPSATKATGAHDLTIGQMVSTPQYWTLTIMFLGSALAGLMVIGCIALFGRDSLVASGAAETASAAGAIAGTAMAAYAILNGLGRIVWGTASDKLGRKTALFLMCLAQGIMMLVFFNVGAKEWGLYIGACIIGFNFGGNFALFPAATADLFGNKNVGLNYPIVFIAYGVAGIVGPQIAAVFKDKAAEAAKAAATVSADPWHTPFIIAGVACLVAALLALTLRPPRRFESA